MINNYYVPEQAMIEKKYNILPPPEKYLDKDIKKTVQKTRNRRDELLNLIEQNPSVYELLSDRQIKERDISEKYLESMREHMQLQKINATDWAMQYDRKFSNRIDADCVLEAFEKDFTNMVACGSVIRDQNHGIVLNKDCIGVATIKMLYPEREREFDELARKILLQHDDRIKQAAYGSRNQQYRDNFLTMVEELCPEYKLTIQEQQRDYWKTQKQDLLLIQEKEVMGERLDPQAMRDLQEAQKYIELESKKETKERLEQRIKQEKEVETVWDRHDSIETAYRDKDMDNVARSESINTKTEKSKAYEVRAHANDIENDNYNVDLDKEDYLKASAEMYEQPTKNSPPSWAISEDYDVAEMLAERKENPYGY